MKEANDFYKRIVEAVYIRCPYYNEKENCCMSNKNPRYDEATRCSEHTNIYFCKGKRYKECPFYRARA